MAAESVSWNAVPLVAIDVGNSRVKVGVFPHATADADSNNGLPIPVDVLSWVHGETPEWPTIIPERVLVASVAPKELASLKRTLPSDWPTLEELSAADLPVSVVDSIDANRVGIDRLADAAAARLLSGDCPSIVVDAGTAITVDLVNAAGQFSGGAILPGLQLSADSLTNRTELLPTIDMLDDSECSLPATATIEAIRGGLRTAVLGGISAVVEELLAASGGDCSAVYFCGGDSETLCADRRFADLFPTGIAMPNLTLSGIALAAERRPTESH